MSFTYKINYKDRNQIQDFENGTRFYFQTILKKLYSLIVFRNLPDSINETFLKQTLFLNGKIIFFENDGELLALNGQYSNTPNVYYIPQNIIIANPVIGSKNLEIGKDCVVCYCSETDVYNFSGLYGGLYYLIMRTAQQLSDCDISINCYLKNTRVFKLIAADDETTKTSAQIAMQKMYSGDTVAIADQNLISKLQSIDIFGTTGGAQVAQSLIDLKQYILAHFYHEIGLNTNDNMKRAHLLETEIDTNVNLVRANIQNIIETISKCIDEVNKMFGTEIIVELSDIYRQSEAEKISNDILTDDNITESSEDLGGGDLIEDEPEEEPEEPAEEEPEAAAEEEPEQEPEAAAEEEPEAAAEEEPEQEPEAAAEEEPEQEPEEPAEEEPEEEPEEPAEEEEIIIKDITEVKDKVAEFNEVVDKMIDEIKKERAKDD